jgi:ankyrin repeat protein
MLKRVANRSSQIMLAAYHGHAPLVKLLLQHGADPNSLNDRGQSPLAGAVFKGETEVIEVSLNTLLLTFFFYLYMK